MRYQAKNLYRSKLRPAQVADIKLSYLMGESQPKIAKRYGICRSYVSDIVNGVSRNLKVNNEIKNKSNHSRS